MEYTIEYNPLGSLTLSAQDIKDIDPSDNVVVIEADQKSDITIAPKLTGYDPNFNDPSLVIPVSSPFGEVQYSHYPVCAYVAITMGGQTYMNNGEEWILFKGDLDYIPAVSCADIGELPFDGGPFDLGLNHIDLSDFIGFFDVYIAYGMPDPAYGVYYTFEDNSHQPIYHFKGAAYRIIVK